MGLTTIEALSCGLPVIVSDCASLPELAPDPDFGRVFSSHDQLVSHLHSFMTGVWPCAGAERKAREFAVTHYSLANIGKRLGEFYRKIHAETIGR